MRLPMTSLNRAVALAALLLTQACTKELLEVTDPDIILDETLQASSASGALGLHNGAILRLGQATAGTQGPDALFVFAGLLTDEWQSGDTFIQRNTMDQRIWYPDNTFNSGPYRNLNRVRVLADAALVALRQYRPTPATNIGRMFGFIAYVQVLMGEHYCNGTPISTLQGSEVVPGMPISNDSMFALAIANADSALLNIGGGDSSRVRWFVQVVRGRALLDRGQFAAAATAVAGVPDNASYDVEYSVVSGDNQIWALNTSARRYTVANAEGTNGLNYRAANDPRIPTWVGSGSSNRIFDTAFPLQVVRQGIWGRESRIKIASGVEARLIEAEAALRANDPTTWLAKLNVVRGPLGLLPVPVDTQYRPVAGTALAALADPGPSTDDALRVNLLFRERAFWLYSTGHRLGDMRRLMRQYGRTEAQTYPVGPWFKGGNFGDAIQMPVPFDEQNNPNFVQCTNRLP
jgi:hypothetical protein